MDKTKCSCGDDCQCTPENHCGCGGHEQEHEHNDGCGCGHDHDHEEFECQTMKVTLEDDTELDCIVLTIFEVEGIEGKEFIALLPPEDEDDESEESEVFLYEYKENSEDDVELVNIETDEEFDRVVDVFNQIMDEE